MSLLQRFERKLNHPILD